MQPSIVTAINQAWHWTGVEAAEVICTNAFGNVLFRTVAYDYWRICPEELRCERVAADRIELGELLADPEFALDWEMSKLVEAATAKLGDLEDGQAFCLRVPAVLGGTYDNENLAVLPSLELLAVSGDLAHQIKDLPEGQRVRLTVRKTPKP